MLKKYDLPDWVLAYKKPNTCIKFRNNSYYLYQSEVTYDANKKRGVKKETYLGTITEHDGLITRRPSKTEGEASKPQNLISKDYGGYALIQKVGSSIYKQLQKVFPDDANMIFTIAALKCQKLANMIDIEDLYDQSYFSVFDKTLDLSKLAISKFLTELGESRDNIVTYMKKDIKDGDSLIFDATNIFCGTSNKSLSTDWFYQGYTYKVQGNLLYGYSLANNRPTLYKSHDGGISDVTIIKETLTEFDLKSCTLLLDNSPQSLENLADIRNSNSTYLISLQSNSKYLTQEILDDFGRLNRQEAFTNNAETIFAYEVAEDNGDRIGLFFNQQILQLEMTSFLELLQKDSVGYTLEGFNKAKKYMGLYIIQTNKTDCSLEKIYEIYKSRIDIEYMFATIKNTFDNDRPYLRTIESFEGWMFINHISIYLMNKVSEYLKKLDILKLYPPIHLFKMLRDVKKQKSILNNCETYQTQAITPKTKNLCTILDIEI